MLNEEALSRSSCRLNHEGCTKRFRINLRFANVRNFHQFMILAFLKRAGIMAALNFSSDSVDRKQQINGFLLSMPPM